MGLIMSEGLYEVYVCKHNDEIVYIGSGKHGRHKHCVSGVSQNYGHNGSKTGEANGSQGFKGWKEGDYDKDLRNPSSVQYFNNRESTRGLHPTQKPVALLEYLIKTYTNEGETVLDFTAGSFSTAIACLNTDRNFIGIELDDNYFDIGVNHIKELIESNNMNVDLNLKYLTVED